MNQRFQNHGRMRDRGTRMVDTIVGTQYFTNGGVRYPSAPFKRLASSYASSGEPRDSVERTWDSIHPGPPYKSGGPFLSCKAKNPLMEVQGSRLYRDESKAPGTLSTVHYYDGGFVPSIFSNPVPAKDMMNVGQGSGFYGEDYGDISGYGAEAWNKHAPKTQQADLSNFIGEFHEIPKMFQQTARSFKDIWRASGGQSTNFAPKKVADEFLNYQFGWVPFISDLRDFYRTYRKFDHYMAQLRRDNNQWVKRSGSVKTNEVVTYYDDRWNDDAPQVWPTLNSNLYSRGKYSPGRPNKFGNTINYTRDIQNVWFSGRFKYFVPQLDRSQHTAYSRVMETLRLYGARVNPAVVWNLMPWTWLADYFLNLGPIISNLTRMFEDNLTAKYAYVMGNTARQNVNFSNIWMKSQDVVCTWVQMIDVKQRTVASPFGFNLSISDLTNRQISIIAALGISRGL